MYMDSMYEHVERKRNFQKIIKYHISRESIKPLLTEIYMYLLFKKRKIIKKQNTNKVIISKTFVPIYVTNKKK